MTNPRNSGFAVGDLVQGLLGWQRYVVSDLQKVGLTPAQAAAVGRNGPLALPPAFPDYLCNRYPWSEPIVFRAGRYLVHRATGSVGKFWNEDRWRETPLD